MPGQDPPELARDLRLAVGRVARRLRRMYVDTGEGLSFLELAVLHRLDASGPTSPGALAGDEGVTGAAVAATLTHLQARHLVTRAKAPEDGRRVVVTITFAGRRTLRHREAASLGRIEQVLRDRLSAAERDQLAAAIPLLEKVATEL
ncbi:MarR family transcriptional regulator [Amycolatopsis mongoliensis]|uniref:MarR family transcriptional regulator n=1 Tax=Amycolatopsis mongoliensis TaxID=715475 RepID=A0A9Y2JJX2_9PSEU|nr:MarR family transcriptional regulator [Amycolatopsis sp. 4-36]WIX99847.1 MarR family transcriptional regulator [Amycolatopsis sp. 4-36]